jgi:hypothetical protein
MVGVFLPWVATSVEPYWKASQLNLKRTILNGVFSFQLGQRIPQSLKTFVDVAVP